MLRDISQQVEWYGRKPDDELEAHSARRYSNRTLFPASTAASWSSAYRPASSRQRKWFNEMFPVMESFAAERGVGSPHAITGRPV